MAPSEPGPEQDLAQRQKFFADYDRFLHTSTLAACFLAPVLIALPPRKLDLYTFSLTGALIASGNYQITARTGLGIMGHASRPFVSRGPLRAQSQDDQSSIWESQRRLLEQIPTPPVERDGSSISVGKAQEDWKQRRLREEQEKLDQGEGYGTMILNQIWQVWNQEEKKMEQVKEKDEEVVRKRKEEG